VLRGAAIAGWVSAQTLGRFAFALACLAILVPTSSGGCSGSDIAVRAACGLRSLEAAPRSQAWMSPVDGVLMKHPALSRPTSPAALLQPVAGVGHRDLQEMQRSRARHFQCRTLR